MSVLVKGMKMPKCCAECQFLEVYNRPPDFDDEFTCEIICQSMSYEEYKTRYVNCPLVEVLPHGDLIDRDELMKTLEITEECQKCKSHVGVHCTRVYFVGACEAICDAPTIIEAEEGG